jgi:DNA-binding MarR family transcriptional regulator
MPKSSRPAPRALEVPLHETPGHLLRRCHQISTALFLQECEPYAITAPQYAVLRVLCEHDRIDQITLAGLGGFNRTTAGELVAKLEAQGYVERADSSEDRRGWSLSITRTGRALVADIDAAVSRVQSRLLEPLRPEERVLFVACLARIAHVNNELSRAPLRAPRRRKD